MHADNFVDFHEVGRAERILDPHGEEVADRKNGEAQFRRPTHSGAVHVLLVKFAANRAKASVGGVDGSAHEIPQIRDVP